MELQPAFVLVELNVGQKAGISFSIIVFFNSFSAYINYSEIYELFCIILWKQSLLARDEELKVVESFRTNAFGLLWISGKLQLRWLRVQDLDSNWPDRQWVSGKNPFWWYLFVWISPLEFFNREMCSALWLILSVRHTGLVVVVPWLSFF